MTATILTMPDAILAQVDVLLTPYTPEGIAPDLIAEYVFGGTLAATLLNHAAPSATSAGVTGIAIGTAGTGQTPGNYNWTTTGGGGNGATGNYTVNGSGVITAATLTTPGAGYTSTPTIVLGASGGTAGTLLASIGRATAIGALTINPHSVTLAGGVRIDLGRVPAEGDQTYIAVLKKPAGNVSRGVIATDTVITGLYWVYTPGPGYIGFHNTQNGTYNNGPAYIPWPGTTDYLFVCARGSINGLGSIVAGAAGALPAVTTATVAGGGRPSTPTLRAGGAALLASDDIAFVANVPKILTDVQVLAWYQALRGDGTGAGSPLGVVLA
ncbi:hypothetical protein [Sphingomonas sp. PB4P5]|uniref:hypothetical protein n=1 Tax=Parasphingomonas puruogangriensis TaxID=3096155 RepID=UPI002FCBF74F